MYKMFSEDQNQRISTKSFAAFFLLTAALLTLSVNHSVNEWTITHWMFSYEAEFLKRGFVGSVLLAIKPNWTITELNKLSLLLALISTFCLLFSAIKFSNKSLPSKLILTYLLAAPFSIQHIGFDLSRFDQFGLLFFAVFVLLINTQYTFTSYLLIPIGILIHETFVFLFLPSYLSFLLIKHRDDFPALKRHISALIFCSLPVFIVVVIFGSSNNHTITEINDLISNRLTPSFDPDSALIFFRSLSENITLTMDALFSDKMLRNLVRFLLVLGPFLFILYKTWRVVFFSAEEKHRPLLAIGLFAQASCLVLFLLGVDFFRWLSALFTCNMLFLIYCLSIWQPWEEIQRLFNLYKKTLYYTGLMALIAGPLSIMAPFKEPLYLLQNLFNLIKSTL